MVTLPLEKMATRVAMSLCHAAGCGEEMVVSRYVAYNTQLVKGFSFWCNSNSCLWIRLLIVEWLLRFLWNDVFWCDQHARVWREGSYVGNTSHHAEGSHLKATIWSTFMSIVWHNTLGNVLFQKFVLYIWK
jgi:hypothetical protein